MSNKTTDTMLGVTLAQGWGDVRDDERAKMAFFEAIGLKDERPYAGMTASETIHAIRANAGITLDDIGKLRKIKKSTRTESARQLIERAAYLWRDGKPNTATDLGVLVYPLLQKKIDAGLISAVDFTPVLQLEARDSENLKEILLHALELPEEATAHYRELSARQLIQHFCNVLCDNNGITRTEFSHVIDPESDNLIQYRISGGAALSGDFMRAFAAAVKPYLETGAKEQWLDKNTLDEKPFEVILADTLPAIANALAGKTGMEALKTSIDASGVPSMALGPMLGYDRNWFTMVKSDTSRTIHPKQVADLAEKLAPYIDKRKSWNGVLEITDPQHLQKHKRIKEYLVGKIEEAAGKDLQHLRQVARNNATVGPFVRQVRTAFGIMQSGFGSALPQAICAKIESNCFNPNCVDGNGVISDGYVEKFNAIAETFAEAYRTQAPAIKKNEAANWRDFAKDSGTQADPTLPPQ